MKKAWLVLLLATAVCGLWGCGAGEESPGPTTGFAITEEAATTAAPPATIAPPVIPTAAPLDPNRVMAVMEPVQGGEMLYEFRGSKPYKYEFSDYDGEEYPVYPIGLINQEGKLVAEPQYTHVKYAYGDNGQIFGLFAHKENALMYYTLDGVAKKMPFEAEQIYPVQNGRYWIVSQYESGGYDRGSEYSFYDGARDGLYDTEKEHFVIAPKSGLALWEAGGLVFGNQRETSSRDSKHLRSFQWNPADGSTKDFPSKWRCQGYYPETGWYEVVEGYDTSHFDIYIVDKDMKIVPELRTRWHIDERFNGGNYLVVRSRSSNDIETWVDRNGVFSDLRYNSIRQMGRCYVAWRNGSEWNGGIPVLLDGMLNTLYEAQEGERFSPLYDDFYDQSDEKLIVLTDQQGNALRAWDAQTGKAFPTKEQNGRWFSGTAFLLQEGRWQVFDLSQYLNEKEDSVNIDLATEDGMILRLGKLIDEIFLSNVRYIAVDWDGKRIDNCPLEPFFDQIGVTAGPQGPNYYWVELNNKRGYIDVKGNWLFVDTTGK